ncbi:MAG TPA: hypothetical protein VHU18_13750 [Rhizomicrobium sp.]|jgi:hypothetical protein|nr:hypothetical protein [Rhizomicrobium sp.]
MSTQTFYIWLEISVLVLGAALAFYYAMNKPEARSLNAVVTIVLAGLAVYRFTHL